MITLEARAKEIAEKWGKEGPPLGLGGVDVCPETYKIALRHLRAVEREALERAAKICEQLKDARDWDEYDAWADGYDTWAADCNRRSMSDVFWRPVEQIMNVMASGEFCLVAKYCKDASPAAALCKYHVYPPTGEWFLSQHWQTAPGGATTALLQWKPTHFARCGSVPPEFYSSQDCPAFEAIDE